MFSNKADIKLGALCQAFRTCAGDVLFVSDFHTTVVIPSLTQECTEPSFCHNDQAYDRCNKVHLLCSLVRNDEYKQF